MTAKPPHRIVLASRASPLALWQAEHVAALIRAARPDVQVEILKLSTIGDRDRSSKLTVLGGQGVFTREVQNALLDGRAHLAVHSLKDLPTEQAAGLVLAGVPQRGSRFDVVALPAGSSASSINDLPPAARIGTGSLRRRAQLLHIRPDLRIEEIRGNVETRISKLDHGEFDAILLAEAGLERLGMAKRITLRLRPPAMFPAVGQGALGLECREDDSITQEILNEISHVPTRAEVLAERACLRSLRAGCHAPVGALSSASASGGQLTLEAVVLSGDGQTRIVAAASGGFEDPETVGRTAAEELFRQGAEKLLNP